jgi:hypothetical protein
LRFNAFTRFDALGHLSQTRVIVQYRVTQRLTNLVDAAKVNLRKHRSAVWRSAVPKLGVTCPTLLPVRSTAFLQLAIFQRLSLPRMDHFGGLPCASK